MKKVGRDLLSYSKVEYDLNGWAKACDYLPDEYDLCYLKTASGLSKRGWWSGNTWDGAHINPGDEIVYWKRNKEEIL